MSPLLPTRHAPRRPKKRRRPPRARLRFGWVSLAASIYQQARSHDEPLDAVVAGLLRGVPLRDDDTRRAVETAYGMLRQSRYLEAVAAELPFTPSLEAKVAIHLLDRGAPLPQDLAHGERAAVLRACAAVEERLGAVPVAEALAMRSPVPAWIADRWIAAFGADVARALCRAMAEEAPIAIRVNTLRSDRSSLQATLDAAGVRSAPCRWAPEGLVLPERVPLTRLAAFTEGFFERQDEGSQLLAHLCPVRPGMRVVDGCAGAGGKTLALAARMQNRGEIWAMDVHRGRLHALKKRARRAGAHLIRTVCLDTEPASAKADLRARVDVVLVDAPCTGSGTFRRGPDLGWKLKPDALDRMVATQRALLRDYAALLKPGGHLVYTTCSLLPEEGQEIAADFLATHGQFRPVSAEEILSAQGIDLATGPYLVLRPDQHGTDGFFGAVFERTGPG